MTKFKTNIFTLTFILVSSLTFGQTDKALTAEQKYSLLESKWKKEDDSLRAEFYKKPKMIMLIFEKNGDIQPFIGEFSIIVDSIEKKLVPDALGQYEMAIKIDSPQTIKLNIVYNKDTFSQQLTDPYEIYNGASIDFGIMTDIRQQSKIGIRKPHNENDILSKKDELYNSVFNNKRILKAARQKKISQIVYFDVKPRVYGCGINTKYVKCIK